MLQLEQLDGEKIWHHVAGWDSSLGKDYLVLLIESCELTPSLQGVSDNIVQIVDCRTFNMIPLSRWSNETHHIKVL
jgi:hypothetical protein